MILETQRLLLRELTDEDYPDLCEILQDKATMYAYEHAFSAGEAWDWLRRQQRRYRDEGFGLWAAVLRESGELVGQVGLTMQDWGERRVPEIGYLLKRRFWHRGYATEAALACRDHALGALGLGAVYAIIRDSNAASRAVAQRCGMSRVGGFVKHYYGVDMPHDVFAVTREQAAQEAVKSPSAPAQPE